MAASEGTDEGSKVRYRDWNYIVKTMMDETLEVARRKELVDTELVENECYFCEVFDECGKGCPLNDDENVCSGRVWGYVASWADNQQGYKTDIAIKKATRIRDKVWSIRLPNTLTQSDRTPAASNSKGD